MAVRIIPFRFRLVVSFGPAGLTSSSCMQLPCFSVRGLLDLPGLPGSGFRSDSSHPVFHASLVKRVAPCSAANLLVLPLFKYPIKRE